MKAKLLLRKRLTLTETCFVDIRIWQVPKPVRGSPHDEVDYAYVDLERLQDDFWKDVELWMKDHTQS
ncbi:hypothetical protein [Pseudorhizobium flavum]|uniref:hypothetical protein n=1 Tax=Pseudorhizobium flavum TaxID=1335061 RepID=UPI00376FBD26